MNAPRLRAIAAAGLALTEQTIIAGRLIAATPQRDLYEWNRQDGRWARLEQTTLLYAKPRKRRYAGHRLMQARV